MSDDLIGRLRSALTPAMRARDGAAVVAIRSALAAVANAEAVPTTAPSGTSLAIGPETAAPGAGSAEAPRRDLGADEIRAIVAHEVQERRDAADEYERHGRTEQAEQLRTEAAVLAAQLDSTAS